MKLIFIKGAGKYDFMEVVRADAPSERIECPKQRIIPHDMVHYAVERTLKSRGFLGRITEGEVASFRMKPEAENDAVERLVEVFQGDEWSGSSSPASEMLDMYAVTCAARDCPPLAVTEADIEAVRSEIGRLTHAWSAVPVGGKLELAL